MLCLISVGKNHKDSAVRGPLMIINQVTASTCNDAADFTYDEKISKYALV